MTNVILVEKKRNRYPVKEEKGFISLLGDTKADLRILINASCAMHMSHAKFWFRYFGIVSSPNKLYYAVITY